MYSETFSKATFLLCSKYVNEKFKNEFKLSNFCCRFRLKLIQIVVYLYFKLYRLRFKRECRLELLNETRFVASLFSHGQLKEWA